MIKFPFTLLIQSIQSSNYYYATLKYAQFYFSNLTFMRDEIFGSLSPLLIAILHGDSKLLRTILDTFGYPHECSSDLTPIEFCSQQAQYSSLDTICCYLIRSGSTKKIQFRLTEFEYLLHSKIDSCHTVISQILNVREDMRFPNLAYIRSESKVYEKKSLMKFLLKLQKGNLPITENDGSIKQKNKIPGKNSLSTFSGNKKYIKSEVEILTVPF